MLEKLQNKLRQSLPNYYRDNYDYQRFGGRPETTLNAEALKNVVKNKLRAFLHLNGLKRSKIWTRALDKAGPMAKTMDYLYDRLQDENSRNTLLEIAAFRILGYRKVKLKNNHPKYWQHRKSVKDLAESETLSVSNAHTASLTKYNLAPIGFPIQLYLTVTGVHVEFIEKQYEYTAGNFRIGVNAGDTVID